MAVSARELDLLGARAWPALDEINLGTWRLRFAGGVTKRANSVLPLGPESNADAGDKAVEQRISLVEHAYEERGLPPRFQLTASSWPEALSSTLRNRGYTESDRTLVLTSSIAADNKSAALCARRKIVEGAQVSAEWFDTWWAVDGRGGSAQARIGHAILERIDNPCLFVECHEPEGIAAVGVGVLDGAWVGLYCLATLPWARRRGCARSIVRTLLASARREGATRAHLAVLEANSASRRLCATFGFTEQQHYSYFAPARVVA